jgi:hypothetical protein
MAEQTTHSRQSFRKRAEALYLEQSSRQPETILRSPADTEKLLHELRVHQIELEMQNEELRLAQVELDSARKRYFDLYDLAPVGYFTLSETGRSAVLDPSGGHGRLLRFEGG